MQAIRPYISNNFLIKSFRYRTRYSQKINNYFACTYFIWIYVKPGLCYIFRNGNNIKFSVLNELVILNSTLPTATSWLAWCIIFFYWALSSSRIKVTATGKASEKPQNCRKLTQRLLKLIRLLQHKYTVSVVCIQPIRK